MTTIPDKCPHCGSDNLTKLSLQKKKSNTGFGCSGCSGCLLLIIILFIAPWILPIIGLGALAGIGGFSLFILENRILVNVAVICAIAIWAYDAYRKSKMFLCMKCGKKFM